MKRTAREVRCAGVSLSKAGVVFARRWRGVVSIPSGPSMIALRDCAYGLARYAAIAQVPILPLAARQVAA